MAAEKVPESKTADLKMGSVIQTKLAKEGEAAGPSGGPVLTSLATDKEVGLVAAMFGAKNFREQMLLQTDMGTALVASRERGEALTLRESLFLLLNEPGSGRTALWTGRLIQVCLVLSALSTAYETVAFVNVATGPAIWKLLKLLFNIFFTIEAVLRLVSYLPLRRIHRSGYVWLDLLTCLPLYLRMFVSPDSMTADNYLTKVGAGVTIRLIDSLACFRILKLCKYFEGATLLATAVTKSLKQLGVPMFMLLLMVFCFGVVVFEIEFDANVQDCTELWKGQGIPGWFIKANPDGATWDCSTCSRKNECQEADASCIEVYDLKCKTCLGYPTGAPQCASVVWGQNFPDITRAMWFTFVTVSTVGYGDVSPVTWQGQIFVCFVITCGLVFLAMPLAIVGSTFGQVWNDRQLFKLQRQMRQLLAQSGIEPTDAVSAFQKIDEGGDGTVTSDEFKAFVTMHGIELERDDMKQLWKALDTDGSGSLSLDEFMERAFPGVQVHTIEGVAAMKQGAEAKNASFKKQDLFPLLNQQQEVLNLLGEQKGRTAELETRLTAIEGMLTELLANKRGPGRSGGSKGDMERTHSTKRSMSRSNSSKTNGRSGTKGKPNGKVFGASTGRSAARESRASKAGGTNGASLGTKLRSPSMSSNGSDLDA